MPLSGERDSSVFCLSFFVVLCVQGRFVRAARIGGTGGGNSRDSPVSCIKKKKKTAALFSWRAGS